MPIIDPPEQKKKPTPSNPASSHPLQSYYNKLLAGAKDDTERNTMTEGIVNYHKNPLFAYAPLDAARALEHGREVITEKNPNRGFIMDSASALARGAAGLAENVGQAMQLADLDKNKNTNFIAKAGESLTGYAQNARDNFKFLQPDAAEILGDEWKAKQYWREGLESVPLSLAPLAAGVAGGVAGTIAGGPVVGGVAGLGAYGATMFGTFGLGTFQKTYTEGKEELIRKGHSEEDAERLSNEHALISSTAEVAGEVLGDIAGALSFGILKYAIKGLGKQAIEQPLKKTIKELIGAGGFKQFGKNLAKAAPFEIGSEMGTAYVQAKSAQERGLDGPDPTDAMVGAIGPSVVLTLLFGLSAHGINAAVARNTYKNLNAEDVNTRVEAVKRVGASLDEENQKAWLELAIPYIESGEAIPIDQPLADFAVQKANQDAGVNSAEAKPGSVDPLGTPTIEPEIPADTIDSSPPEDLTTIAKGWEESTKTVDPLGSDDLAKAFIDDVAGVTLTPGPETAQAPEEDPLLSQQEAEYGVDEFGEPVLLSQAKTPTTVTPSDPKAIRSRIDEIQARIETLQESNNPANEAEINTLFEEGNRLIAYAGKNGITIPETPPVVEKSQEPALKMPKTRKEIDARVNEILDEIDILEDSSDPDKQSKIEALVAEGQRVTGNAPKPDVVVNETPLGEPQADLTLTDEPQKEISLSVANIPIGRIQAKKQSDGSYKLFYRGTENEIFTGKTFKSASEAHNFFKAQKVKAQEAAALPAGESTVPDGWEESQPGGMMINKNPGGGIIDKEIKSGKWFAIPQDDGIEKITGLPTREAAHRALVDAVKAKHNVGQLDVSETKTGTVDQPKSWFGLGNSVAQEYTNSDIGGKGTVLSPRKSVLSAVAKKMGISIGDAQKALAIYNSDNPNMAEKRLIGNKIPTVADASKQEAANASTEKDTRQGERQSPIEMDTVTDATVKAWLEKNLKPALDIRNKETGWDIAEHRDGTVLKNNETGKLLLFANKNPKSGGAAIRTRNEAHAYAIDNRVEVTAKTPEAKAPKAEKKTIPARDTELTTIQELSDRIKSIDRQIESLDSVRNPKDFGKHTAKAAKLNERKDRLWTKRAKLIRAERKTEAKAPKAKEPKDQEGNARIVARLNQARSELPDGFTIQKELTSSGEESISLLKDGVTVVYGLGYTEAGITEAVRQADLKSEGKDQKAKEPKAKPPKAKQPEAEKKSKYITEGKKVTVKFKHKNTGAIVSAEIDAAKAIKDIDEQLSILEKIATCME